MRVSALRKTEVRRNAPKYGIVTHEILEEMFTRRLLYASLLARADSETAFIAGMVYSALISVKMELEELIS